MADSEEEKEAERTVKKGKSPLRLVVLLVGIVVAGGGGYFAYGKFLSPKLRQAQAPQEKAVGPNLSEEGKDGGMGPVFHMDPYIVNLAGSDGRRYLKTTIELEMSSDKLQPEVQKRLPMLRDAILVLLSSKRFEDISDVQGKIKLRDEIERKMDGLMGTGKIKKVYFTEFVIQ